MRLSLSKAIAVVLAAFGSAFIWLLSLDASAAAGGQYPVPWSRRPLTPTTYTTETAVALLIVAAAVAVGLLLMVYSAHRKEDADADSPAATPEQRREQPAAHGERRLRKAA